MNRIRPLKWVLPLLSLSFISIPEAFAARHAIVIGNDGYKAVPRLRNAIADAEAMGKALRSANYDVTVLKNRDLRQMMADVRRFKAKLQAGDEVVFFFAGHGVQIGAVNYLLPVDLQSESEDQVRDESIALSRILEDLREQKPALVLAIVDACRDNPFKSSGRSIGGRGLTGVAGATGQMVIYSAGEGQKALDSLGPNDPVRNGVFTRVFVQEMAKPGLSVNQIVRNVRSQVNQLARRLNHEQVPAIYDQVLGTFYFVPGSAGATAAVANSIPGSTSAATSLEVELSFWNSVKDSRHSSEVEAYLARFPEGRFAAPARARLAILANAASNVAQRPKLPFTLTDEVWSAIETSDAYAKVVAPGTSATSYHLTTKLPQGASEMLMSTASQVVNGSAPAYAQQTFTMKFSSKVMFRTIDSTTSTVRYFALGFLPLGTTAGGQSVESLTRVGEISGSLFPIRENAELTMSYNIENKVNHLATREVKLHCRAVAPVKAMTIRTSLTGNAWPIDCTTNTVAGGKSLTTRNRSFYLEDYRVMSDMISVSATMPGESGADVIPASSTHSYTFDGVAFAVKDYEVKFGQ